LGVLIGPEWASSNVSLMASSVNFLDFGINRRL